jgi:hypothetical protein
MLLGVYRNRRKNGKDPEEETAMELQYKQFKMRIIRRKHSRGPALSVNRDAMFARGSSHPPREKVRVTSLSCLVVGLISCENMEKQVFALSVCNFEQTEVEAVQTSL